MAQTHTDKSGEEGWHFGWAEIIAAALAVGLAVLISPAPASSATIEDEDWNFLWVKPAEAGTPSDARTSDEGRPIQVAGTYNVALQPFADRMALPRESMTFTEANATSSNFDRRIEMLPIGARHAPPVDGGLSSFQPAIALREDRWSMDVDGVVRLSAYARGTLDREDMSLVRSPMPFPRGLGTGVGMMTSTPVYVGATVKTDRSIYDIDPNRFDGARWSTSVFMGTDTSLGPLYLGTSKDANGARSAYLYLGRWF
jgi:hypothetical protein